jgi:hypothetical protein
MGQLLPLESSDWENHEEDWTMGNFADVYLDFSIVTDDTRRFRSTVLSSSGVIEF